MGEPDEGRTPLRNKGFDSATILGIVGAALGTAALAREDLVTAALFALASASGIAAWNAWPRRRPAITMAAITVVFCAAFVASLPSGGAGIPSATSVPERPEPAQALATTPSPSPSPLPSPSQSTAPVFEPESHIVFAQETHAFLNGAVRVSVSGIDFGGEPLRDRVYGLVRETSSGQATELRKIDVGFRTVVGRRQRYEVVLLAVNSSYATFEVRRLPAKRSA
jgi:hypothetical protein